MDHRARFGFLQRRSYAPQLSVDIPAEIARQTKCTVFTLIPLPPALLYDPFTARIERSEAVSDAQFLGHLELEKAVGWAGEGAYEDEVRRTWWERNDFQDPDLAPPAARLESCHGKACEHTALLLELDRAALLGTQLFKLVCPVADDTLWLEPWTIWPLPCDRHLFVGRWCRFCRSVQFCVVVQGQGRSIGMMVNRGYVSRWRWRMKS